MSIEIGGGGGGGSSRNVARSFGPPPAFLIKTFQIVNDANTNSIVSWGQNGESFIIWDHIKFSAEILPNYFRHNNFSSFVYQLNNYGFRKIGVDHQWEYSSGDFQQGKAHLLSNMKRRSVQMNPTPPHQKTLRNSLEESRREMKKMKKQQSDMELNIVELRQAAKNLEASSKKLVVQWAKACEIILKREKGVVAEIPLQENGENHENEVVEEDAVSLSQKQPMVSSSAANDESKSMEILTVEDYLVELDNIKTRDDDDDDVYEVEAPNHAIAIAIAQDFQEWLIENTLL